MGFIKIFFMLAITMAMTIAITMTINGDHHKEETQQPVGRFAKVSHEADSLIPAKRMSRFLAQYDTNPRGSDHCNKDYEACYVHGQNATTCCNNKCIDVHYDKKNCGKCGKKCKYTETCCRGECVNIYMDKRHCGACNNRCNKGDYCVYGMCNYA